MEKDKKLISALDEYINKVYILVLLLVPGACECAGLAYTFSKVVGWLPEVSWPVLIIFDITCLLYLAIGIYFIKTGISDGVVRNEKLRAGKLFLVIIIVIQFNFIVYMIPATDFWGFAFFFVILTAFFLDYKMVTASSVGIGLSIVVSWIMRGEIHLPAKDAHFAVNMLDRVVCVALSLVTMVLFTYLINRFLVNAKKDEMQRNTEHVQTVLNAVQELSDSLCTAGQTLSQVSGNETASAEKLAATSEQLANGSDVLSARTDESMDNLGELNRWSGVVAENVQKVENNAQELLDKSKQTEQLLGDLSEINSEVTRSMSATTETTEKLSEAVDKIGETLNLINEISTSTNLLALNASIEAARAGDAGKGFAVVATEVGNLANNTQESLKNVQEVIARVQQNVEQITVLVEENATKLGRQNDYYQHVFEEMHEMTRLLHVSVDAIRALGDAHQEQAEVIRHTVSINQDIAESIKNENEQFGVISAMADSNAADTTQLAAQADTINDMVQQITELLRS